LGASLLLGEVAAVDISDAAGMNLMDIRTKKWHEKLLDFVAPGQTADLRRRLAEPQNSWEVCGTVHSFWMQRYGFVAECNVVAWSGDNPCAVVGNGLVEEGDIAISLGTSDTALSVIPDVPKSPLPFGHLFPHPILKSCYWSMLCYTNGDVTRRRVRDDFFAPAAGAEGKWSAFSEALRATEPGNGGAVGMFFTTDEITPAVNQGGALRGRGAAGQEGIEPLDRFEDARQNARAVIEMRALSIRNHLSSLMPSLLERTGSEAPQLLLTGGASCNPDILQVFADVFQRPVRCMENFEGAAFGAAVRALHAVDPKAAPDLADRLRALSSVRATPAPGSAAPCAAAAAAYARLEAKAVKEHGRF